MTNTMDPKNKMEWWEELKHWDEQDEGVAGVDYDELYDE